jgi:TetR/AcrR family transcriptional regulator
MSSVTPDKADPVPRMRAEDRRELVITAAMEVFGERGYVGATTDAVARAAGVSQPYVVRMFGTKEALFLAVLDRALHRLLDVFRGAIQAGPAAPGELHQRIGTAYADLLADRGLLLSLMHAFVSGADPVIGHAARCGFLDVYRLLRQEAGFSADEARGFLAEGMLLNTLVGIRMADDYERDADARELIDITVPTKSELLVRLSRTPS